VQPKGVVLVAAIRSCVVFDDHDVASGRVAQTHGGCKEAVYVLDLECKQERRLLGLAGRNRQAGRQPDEDEQYPA
jgi:hypothetical protein